MAEVNHPPELEGNEVAMGKTSRKAKQKRRRKGGVDGAVSAGAATSPRGIPGEGTHITPPPPAPPAVAECWMPPPTGAECWICLEGDPDDEGKPLVRDCSCRGDHAGFAHLSCLVEYAKRKTRESEMADVGGFDLSSWETCPRCCRAYRGHVALDMAKSLLTHIDEKPWSELEKITPLSTILNTVQDMDCGHHDDYSTALREEGRRAANQVISLIQGADCCDDIGDGIKNNLMYAYIALAKYAEVEETTEGFDTALHYYGLARDYCSAQGREGATIGLEARMKNVESKRDGGDIVPYSDELLDRMRDYYEKRLSKDGEDDTVQDGIYLLNALCDSGKHDQECERLSAKILATSRRVHGPDHALTVAAERGRSRCNKRFMV